MGITQKELNDLLHSDSIVDRVATVSSDGRNLLVRLPREVRESLGLEKGDKLRFLVNAEKELQVNIVLADEKKKKEKS